MTEPEISGIAPLFIVNNVPAALAFYRDRLGFDVTFQGPEPDDIFFGIVRRAAAMIVFKAVGVAAVPNYTRDVKKGIVRWDAYLDVPDPDALAAELSSRNVEFSEPLKDTDHGLRGFELKDADGYVLFFGRPRSRTLNQIGIRSRRVSLGADQPAVDCESSLRLALVHGLLREDM
jgi:catechol 2,3-dioxygenase-like lactoylglutathione lyase family enzyme